MTAVRRRSLVYAIFIGATAGFWLSVWSWPEDRSGGRAKPQSVGEREADFSDPAFSAGASAADLKSAALRVAKGLVADYPESAEAWDILARTHFNLSGFDSATEAWEKCVALDPRLIEAWYGLGFIAHTEGDHERAVDKLRKAAALSASDVRVPVLLAEELMKLNRIEEAVTMLESHVSGPLASAAALVSLGQAYLQLQQNEKARRTLELAAQIAPDKKSAVYGLATVCARLGDQAAARRYQEEFAKLDAIGLEKGIEAYQQINDDVASTRQIAARAFLDAGRFYRGQKRPGKASELLRKVVVLDSDHIEARKELLALYEEGGRDAEALEICRQLSRLQPDNGDHWLNLGLLRARLGDFEGAATATERALEIDPDNAKYREVHEVIARGK